MQIILKGLCGRNKRYKSIVMNPKVRLFCIQFAVLISCIFFKECTAQSNNFRYKAIPQSYFPKRDIVKYYADSISGDIKRGYDLTASLPEHYVTDGSVDYTKYLQQGISANHTVIFPDFPVLVNSGGISLISNSVVIFRPHSKLIMEPNALTYYQIIGINNVNNVVVYFPNLEGDRYKHKGNSGEWGMGISISDASNIKLINPKISHCWGDGIYLGKRNKGNKNIYIVYAELDNNRRNGISVIDASGLYIKNPLITNTQGTAPMSGIDIEPNNNNDNIDHIVIDSPVTINNAGSGIFLETMSLKGPQQKDVNITINNPVDDNSTHAFGTSVKDDIPITGQIQINNPIWKNGNPANKTYINANDRADKFKVKLQNPVYSK